MNVASLELCTELYQLSGWESGHWTRKFPSSRRVPAYDLGYILRKLPIDCTVIHVWYRVDDPSTLTWFACGNIDRYHLGFTDRWPDGIPIDSGFRADTPEDAAVKLAIELLKQGILTKDQP